MYYHRKSPGYWIIVDYCAARIAANRALDWRFLYTGANRRLDHDDADDKRKLYTASNEPERAHRSPARLRLAPVSPKRLTRMSSRREFRERPSVPFALWQSVRRTRFRETLATDPVINPDFSAIQSMQAGHR